MYVNEVVNELLNQFKNRTNKERPFNIAVDGLSGSGKTTLVKKLENELKNKCIVSLFHIDDHIVERNKRYNTAFEEWYEYYYLQWDMEMISEKLLKSLHRNYSELNLPYYDKSIDKNANKKVHITPNSIILIEGIFLQRREWIAFYDYTIFWDCPREIRFERVLNRDYIGDSQTRLDKYKRRYWLGEEHYLNTEEPIKKANKIYIVN
ncbi:kinase [Bacillus sp. NEB1478]|uniref:kinase n=1 Tax=Bacillus sp. NEB1478 TaxID=3073816 RepID=UPI002872E6FF|nr:kinase [Bacillus sp. NEB1478]WNB90978.1 kinase [Bacillus sp. NEB1478]